MIMRFDPRRVCGKVPALRGVYVGDSPEPFVEEDVARLKEEVGVTCIRYGMEPRALASEGDVLDLHEDGFCHVGRFLDWCAQHGIACVLDLHNAHGRLYGGDPRLWRDEGFQDRFVRLWEAIVRRFVDHPAVAAWELLNEPEPPDQDFGVWNRLYRRTLAAIRRIDPDRAVVIDSINYARPECFSGLEPADDPHVVYSFHNYQPGPYHCQKRRELEDRSTYYYPGFIPHVRPRGGGQDFSLAHYEPSEGKHWNRRQLAEEWSAPVEFARKHRAPLFCGEFGCVSDVPPMTDMVYLADEISLFHEAGIHWTLYNTMYRTSDPWWKDRFDCGLYIWYSPEQCLLRFRRKIALMRLFCRPEGEVLAIDQPEDEWIGCYGLRRTDGGLSLLVYNKHRQEDKEATVSIEALPQRWSAVVRTMNAGDDDFVLQGTRVLEAGRVPVHLPQLSLALLEVPAPSDVLWSAAAGPPDK